MASALHDLLYSCEGFEWDTGNQEKNWQKHGVTKTEAEEAFFDTKLTLLQDPQHSHSEPRFIALGKTLRGRLLYLVWTHRHKKIRVISARDMTKTKEVELYEKAA